MAECIAKRFGGKVVLTAASLRVEAGAITALVGRNGVGKSTLLKIASGWTRPDEGSVHFRGKYERPGRPHRLAAQGLFYLPDRALLSPGFTVREHLASGERRWGQGTMGEVAHLAGIEQYLDRRPPALSGGEQRRAELALAFVRAPQCLLADEPFRGLAPYDAETVTAMLRGLAGRGCGVLITGHEIRTFWNFLDRVVWCTDGTTYDLGSPVAAASDWRFRQAYLATPIS